MESEFSERRAAVENYLKTGDRAALQESAKKSDALRKRARQSISHNGVEANDADYIFISFVRRQFPVGLVGLLLLLGVPEHHDIESDFVALLADHTLDRFTRGVGRRFS